MRREERDRGFQQPDAAALKAIITDPGAGEQLVLWADRIGAALVADRRDQLSTSQIRAIFGEVRQIQGEWTIRRDRALRRLILLRPKMAYRAKKESGNAVKNLVSVLDPAVGLVIQAKPRPSGVKPGTGDYQDDNMQRFAEFFEAILAYHKAHGGK